jgi:hypothetical protein
LASIDHWRHDATVRRRTFRAQAAVLLSNAAADVPSSSADGRAGAWAFGSAVVRATDWRRGAVCRCGRAEALAFLGAR